MNPKLRYVGVLGIFALAASFAPMTALAAEATVNTERNPVIVFTMIILLLGAVTAALFFASPLRKRFTGEESEPAPMSTPPQPTPQQERPAPTSPPEPPTSPASESGLWWGQPPEGS